MKRLLIVVNDAPFFYSHRLPIGRACRRLGWSVTVVAPRDPAIARRLCFYGINFRELPLSRRRLNPLGELLSLFSLFRTYILLKPDLVHHVTQKPVLYGGLIARGLGLPCINALSGLGAVYTAGQTNLLRRVSIILHRLVHGHARSRTIFQNEDDRAFMLNAGVGVRSHCRLVRGSGVDPHEYVPPRKEPVAPIIVVPARMLADKGIREVATASALLDEWDIPHRIDLCGGLDPGNPRALTELELRSLETSSLRWLGHCPDMVPHLQGAQIVCLPSYREGAPRALIEASSCARPIVTTDVPGCRQVVVDNETGVLVPPRDAAALAAALRDLLTNPARRLTMGLRGRQFVFRHLQLSWITSAHLWIYRELLASSSRTNEHSGKAS